jgi:signal peptidase II
VAGGVLGNLYDRLGLPGLDWGILRADRKGEPVYAVRDFVLVARHWPPRNRWDVWPNFNVADSLLVCGALSVAALGSRAARRGEPPS